MSVEVNSQLEVRDLRYSRGLSPTVQALRSLSQLLSTVKRYVDVTDAKLLAAGVNPALMARGPTAVVLGLVVSALMRLFHRTAAP